MNDPCLGSRRTLKSLLATLDIDRKYSTVALSNLDRELLRKCLSNDSSAWQEFTDRFLGLIVHVVNLTAASRNIQITPESRDDLVAEVFLSWIEKDFDALRRFRGNSSLATYLTVIARRVIVRRLSQLRIPHPSIHSNSDESLDRTPAPDSDVTREEIVDLHQILEKLSSQEAAVVRMYHVEGRSYEEISQETGLPENSVGPILSKAREKIKSLS